MRDMVDGTAVEKYHAKCSRYSPDSELEKFASDPNCFEQESCAKLLAERLARKQADERARIERKKEIEENPFDFRDEVSADSKLVSADARYIVKHLWIIFVLLPFVLGLVFAIVTGLR
jgi:hypothetical protein